MCGVSPNIENSSRPDPAAIAPATTRPVWHPIPYLERPTEPGPQPRVEVAQPVQDRQPGIQPGIDRALRIVLVRERISEASDDAVAQKMGRVAAVALDGLAGKLM